MFISIENVFVGTQNDLCRQLYDTRQHLRASANGDLGLAWFPDISSHAACAAPPKLRRQNLSPQQ
jgi:hypothetical protein